MTRRRSRLAGWRRPGVLLGAAALSVTLLPGTAAALPGDPPPTADQLIGMVADASHRLEVVSEQVNTAEEQLREQQSALVGANQAVADAETRLGALDGQIRQIARSAYTQGDNKLVTLDVLLTSRSAGDFVTQLSTLNAIAGRTNDTVEQVATAADDARAAKERADRAEAEAARTLAEITGKKGQLESQIADYQWQYDALTAPQRQQVDQVHGGQSVAQPAAAAPVAAPDPNAAAAPSRAAAPVAAAAAPVAAPDPNAAAAPAAAAPSGAAQTAVSTALAQVGKPYVFGAAGPSAFDCSGLMQYSWAAAGRSLPHSSSMQSGMGTPVSRDQLQPGDLLFFYSPVSHVAMYIGNGQMVHASTSGQPVKVVDVGSVPGLNSARRLT